MAEQTKTNAVRLSENQRTQRLISLSETGQFDDSVLYFLACVSQHYIPKDAALGKLYEQGRRELERQSKVTIEEYGEPIDSQRTLDTNILMKFGPIRKPMNLVTSTIPQFATYISDAVRESRLSQDRFEGILVSAFSSIARQDAVQKYIQTRALFHEQVEGNTYSTEFLSIFPQDHTEKETLSDHTSQLISALEKCLWDSTEPRISGIKKTPDSLLVS